MSYCRMRDKRNEVYMFDSGSKIVCCGCRLGAKRCNFGELHLPTHILTKRYTQPTAIFETRSAAIHHLMEHKKQGQRFPMRAITRLKTEIREVGDKV